MVRVMAESESALLVIAGPTWPACLRPEHALELLQVLHADRQPGLQHVLVIHGRQAGAQPLLEKAHQRLLHGPVVRQAQEGPGFFRREVRSEEHTSELQSLMSISYGVICVKKKIPLTSKHL